jgi:predicted transcriptional regulator
LTVCLSMVYYTYMKQTRKHINSIIKEISQYYKVEAQILFDLLKKKGVTSREIAKALDVTESAISIRFVGRRV